MPAAGAGLAPWGIVAAAAVPLAIATGPRLAWATRAWVLAAISFALAWLPGRLSAGAAVLAPDGVLVAAAIGLAFAAGLGVAAVLDDLRRFRFGWRQAVMIAAFAGLGLSVVGLAADTLSGRFGLRADDWPSTYSWMTDNAARRVSGAVGRRSQRAPGRRQGRGRRRIRAHAQRRGRRSCLVGGSASSRPIGCSPA